MRDRNQHPLSGLLREAWSVARKGEGTDSLVALGVVARLLDAASHSKAFVGHLADLEGCFLDRQTVRSGALFITEQALRCVKAAVREGNPWLQAQSLSEEERRVLAQAVNLRDRLACFEALARAESLFVSHELPCGGDVFDVAAKTRRNVSEASEQLDTTFGPTARTLADAMDLALEIRDTPLAFGPINYETRGAWWRFLLEATEIHQHARVTSYEAMLPGERQTLLGRVPLPPPIRGTEHWHPELIARVQYLAELAEPDRERPLERYLRSLAERQCAIDSEFHLERDRRSERSSAEKTSRDRIEYLESQLDGLDTDLLRAARLLAQPEYQESATPESWVLLKSTRTWITCRLLELGVEDSAVIEADLISADVSRRLRVASKEEHTQETDRRLLAELSVAIDSPSSWLPLSRVARKSVVAAQAASPDLLTVGEGVTSSALATLTQMPAQLVSWLGERVRTTVRDLVATAPEPLLFRAETSEPVDTVDADRREILWTDDRGELSLAVFGRVMVFEWHPESPTTSPPRLEIGPPWRPLEQMGSSHEGAALWRFEPSGPRVRLTWEPENTLEISL